MKLRSFRNLRSSYLILPVFYSFALLFLPVILPLFIALKGLKSIIHFYLQLKYGSLYGGLVQGIDSVYTIESEGRCIIEFVLFLEHRADEENFIKRIKCELLERMAQHLDLFPKFHCIQRKCFGFPYFLKNQIDIANCIQIFENSNNNVRFTQTELEENLSLISLKPLPQKNKALWEILLFSKPVQSTDNENVLPMIFRFDHIVGDGLSLTKAVKKILQGDDDRREGIIKLNIYEKHKLHKTKLVEILHIIHVLLITPIVVFYQAIFRKAEDHIFYKKSLSGEKIMAYTTEKTSELVPKVKKLKKSIQTKKFTDFVLTAVSRAIYTSMKQRSVTIPESVSMFLPVSMASPEDMSDTNLRNNFSYGLVDLPINIGSNSYKEALEIMGQEMNILRKSNEFLINSLLIGSLSSVLPQGILKEFIKTENLTLIVNNIPGIEETRILSNIRVRDIIFFTPPRGTLGITINILTYDNRFQVAVSVDKAIIDSKEEVSKLCENILGQIELMYQELQEVGTLTRS